MRQNVTVATRKPYFIAVTFALVCFLTLGLFGYYYVQAKWIADKPKVETVERMVIITDDPAYDEFKKQARKQDYSDEVIYSSSEFTIHARNRGSAGKVLFRYHFENPNTDVPHMTNWYHLDYFEAGEVKTVKFGLPNPGRYTDGKSIYTVTVNVDFVEIGGTMYDYTEVFAASCLVLVLLLGILGMLFFFRLVRKAPVVNERTWVSKKAIISVLSSLWVGGIFWLLGWYASAVIVRTILDHVYVNFLWENFSQVNSLVAAAPSLVAMIWFGYKIYRRLTAAELLVAGEVGRKCGDAARKTPDDLSA